MSARFIPGRKAIETRGFVAAFKWLAIRRAVQFGVIAAFLAGPLAGYWIVKGNLASSLVLETLPLSDPYIQLQSLIAGHSPEADAILGALILVGIYALAGGRAFCAWVCPINIVTDGAHWLRRKFGLTGGINISRSFRYWILSATFIVALAGGTIAWELANPVTIVFRGLIFGMGFAWAVLAAVFLLDLFVGTRPWCGHLCPVGAFYSLIGTVSIARISAAGRARCDDCLDCYAVCPEPQVITPALKGAAANRGPVILSPNCTNCGRCIDVCPEDIFKFTTRFGNRSPERPVPGHAVGTEKAKEAA